MIGVATALWQLSTRDLVDLPFWMVLTMGAIGLVVGGIGQLILHRSKQFEALEQADQVFRATSAVGAAAPVGASPAPRPLTAGFEREPVVYLRPFEEDNGWRSVLHDYASDTGFEEQLSLAVESIGPMIAIGQPGESLPTPGAVRWYASHDEWRDVVLAWMARARLIILRPGATPGVAWEIEAALSSVPAEKLLLLIVRMRPKRYEITKAFFEAHHITLPPFDDVASLGSVSSLFAFDDEYRVRPIPLAAPFWRGPDFGRWQKRFHYALRPYFERHDLAWVPLPLRTGLLVYLLMMAVAIVLIIGTSAEEQPVILQRPTFSFGPER